MYFMKHTHRALLALTLAILLSLTTPRSPPRAGRHGNLSTRVRRVCGIRQRGSRNRYKGTRTAENAFGQWAIDLSGSIGQWYAVGP